MTAVEVGTLWLMTRCFTFAEGWELSSHDEVDATKDPSQLRGSKEHVACMMLKVKQNSYGRTEIQVLFKYCWPQCAYK